MCGIAGSVSLRKQSIDINYARHMADKISHRGPDDAGYLFFHTGAKHSKKVSFFLNLTDKNFKSKNQLLPLIEDEQVKNELNSHDWDLFFGHRRLAIIDLSPLGHQPMSDLSKNIWVTYNGEIYNFKEIKSELEKLGHKFKSSSDTEVIIYSYIEWGIKCIDKFNGMFAFVLYDNFNKKLFLARDRYGIKPLYYTEINGTLVFASEIKSILEYKDYKIDMDYEALIEYFTFQNFLTDKTLYKDVKIVPAGCYIETNLSDGKISSVQYWDFDFSEPDRIKDEREYIEELDRLFCQAVKNQLISDVEVGSYLSGGIDTGSIAALASKYIKNLKTFTIGFDLTSISGLELAFDERAQAEFMSYKFGTEHYEMVLKSGDMERCLPDFAYYLEEPRVGQSYPNFYASKLASKFVKVVLSGTGGDELFGGYPWRYYRAVVNDNFEDYIDKYYIFWQRLISNKEIKKVFMPVWDKVSHVWTKDIFNNVFKKHAGSLTSPVDYINHSLYFEAKTFLHGLLTVEDKLSMAYGIETRVPFLDNGLVDFAMKIPVRLKLKNFDKVIKIDENEPGGKKEKYFKKTNDGKLILRKAIEKYVPSEIINNKKQGFSAPDSSWFKGNSIDYVRQIIYNDKSHIFNFLDKSAVRDLVGEHLRGRLNRRLFIWSLLNFEWWLRKYLF